MSATSGPIIPPSWTVPAWYVDPANATGCASNGNSCTSQTCGSSGIGPCLLVSEITAHRWGTASPVLAQNTSITALSSETVGQESVVLSPVTLSSSVFGIVGTPQLLANTTLGTTTAKSRATGVRLHSTILTGGLSEGMLVVNTTRANSWALISNVNGTTITFAQPLAALGIANASQFPVPVENDTWATGDSVAISTLPKLNVIVLNPAGGTTNTAFTGGVTWVQNVWLPDPSGTVGDSTMSFQSQDNYMSFVGCRFDPFIFTGPGQLGVDSKYFIGCGLQGAGDVSFASVMGGYVDSSVLALNNYGCLDLDVQCMAGVQCFAGGQKFIGWAYIAGSLNVSESSLVKMTAVNGTSYAIWGTCNVEVDAQCTLLNHGGTIWANTMLTSGTLTLDGNGTGSSYAANAFTDGRSLTAANLDTFQSLQNPATGARYATGE